MTLREPFRPRPGSNRDRYREQDRAAGGRKRREVELKDGRIARASVSLSQHNRAVYAYLRYFEGGRTVTRYIGPVPGRTREEALRAGWQAARAAGLVGQ